MSVETKRNAKPVGSTRTARNPVDVHIGNQVRLKRIAVGQSKEELSESLGVTVRQLEKYESGSNRIGPSRLLQIARMLCTEPSMFFEGSGAASGAMSRTHIRDSEPRFLQAGETLDLLESFFRIREAACRARVVELARELSRDRSDAV